LISGKDILSSFYSIPLFLAHYFHQWDSPLSVLLTESLVRTAVSAVVVAGFPPFLQWVLASCLFKRSKPGGSTGGWQFHGNHIWQGIIANRLRILGSSPEPAAR